MQVLIMLKLQIKKNIPELQLQGTESSIKNKVIDLLSKVRGFNFVTTLVLEGFRN